MKGVQNPAREGKARDGSYKLTFFTHVNNECIALPNLLSNKGQDVLL